MRKRYGSVVFGTYGEYGDDGSLHQSHQHVAPVVFVVRHTRVSYVQRKRHQEELDRGSNQSRPLPLHSGLDVELCIQTYRHWHRGGGSQEDDLFLFFQISNTMYINRTQKNPKPNKKTTTNKHVSVFWANEPLIRKLRHVMRPSGDKLEIQKFILKYI